ncbi:pyrazinamidase/nicotinamidase [Holotrichia oblita]|uniref:Pyrazinamidase/nicotinamidase n=1 Tax=Holotrichia oblita TaxID=644536 RepID=A0ACB9SSB2_HOLOL|nr:pyrazinamidase/nicotinamidase [Holotrichia oblita]
MDPSFDCYDKDGDGKLNFDDFCFICTALFKNDAGENYLVDEEKLERMFNVFDVNKDGFIDRYEFDFCWKNWIEVLFHPISVLIIADVQNDIISGEIAVTNSAGKPNGHEIIRPINQLIDTVDFRAIFYAMDWHPSDHISFFDNLPLRELHATSPSTCETAQLYDEVIFTGPPMKKQQLWPRHCVQNTSGAELHPDLRFIENGVKIYKGIHSEVESYSAFWDNDRLCDTTLYTELRQRDVTDVYICGLAYECCVKETAMDALNLGYRTILIDDCIRGRDPHSTHVTKQSVLEQNGVIVNSNQVKGMVEGRDRRPELAYSLALRLRTSSAVDLCVQSSVCNKDDNVDDDII